MFDEDSLRNLRDSIAAGRPLTGPLDLQLLPTSRCNAACAFCPLVAIPAEITPPRFQNRNEDLSGGLLDRLADDLYHLGGLRRVTITGGEPLLYPQIIPAIFQLTRCFNNVELTLVTNGIRLKKFAGIIVAAGVHQLSVSLNAGTAESYRKQNPAAGPDAFDEIVAGLEAVAAERKGRGTSGPRVGLSVVLTEASAADVKPLFELARRTGVGAVTFIPLMEIMLAGRVINRNLAVTPKALSRFFKDLGEYAERARSEGFWLGYAGTPRDQGVIDNHGAFSEQPCFTGYTFAAVYPNGDVRPCCHCESVMGNLKEQSFGEIWQGEKFQEFRRRALAIVPEGMDGCLCRECGYLYENREFDQRLRQVKP